MQSLKSKKSHFFLIHIPATVEIAGHVHNRFSHFHQFHYALIDLLTDRQGMQSAHVEVSGNLVEIVCYARKLIGQFLQLRQIHDNGITDLDRTVYGLIPHKFCDLHPGTLRVFRDDIHKLDRCPTVDRSGGAGRVGVRRDDHLLLSR